MNTHCDAGPQKKTAVLDRNKFAMSEALIIFSAEKVFNHFGAEKMCMYANSTGIVVTGDILFQRFCTQVVVRFSETELYGRVVYDSRFLKCKYVVDELRSCEVACRNILKSFANFHIVSGPKNA